MNVSELKPDTLSQLQDGTTFTSADGMVAIIGDTDVIAFRDADGNWQVAENVYFNNVEGLDLDAERLKQFARKWVHKYGSTTVTKHFIVDDIRTEFNISNGDAHKVLRYIQNATVTIEDD